MSVCTNEWEREWAGYTAPLPLYIASFPYLSTNRAQLRSKPREQQPRGEIGNSMDITKYKKAWPNTSHDGQTPSSLTLIHVWWSKEVDIGRFPASTFCTCLEEQAMDGWMSGRMDGWMDGQLSATPFWPSSCMCVCCSSTLTRRPVRGRSIIVTAWREQRFTVPMSSPQSLRSPLWKPTTCFIGSQVGTFPQWWWYRSVGLLYPSNTKLHQILPKGWCLPWWPC